MRLSPSQSAAAHRALALSYPVYPGDCTGRQGSLGLVSVPSLIPSPSESVEFIVIVKAMALEKQPVVVFCTEISPL